MNELEKRAKYHRKRQKGLSPFTNLKPDNMDCILTNPGNEEAMSDFNKGTSLSTDSALSEAVKDANMFSIGDRVIFYEPSKGRQTWGIIKDFVNREGSPEAYAVIKSTTGRVYKISLKELEDEMEFDLDEGYEEDARERSAHVNELKKYWKNFDGNIKGKRISNAQIDAIVSRLRAAETEDKIYNDPDFYKRKVTMVVDDPKYNFEDPEREGEYQVEKMLEHLAEVEDEAYKHPIPECYDLQDLYEEVRERLTPSEKQELNKVLNSTNDPETIQNYLTALRTKNEDIDDVEFKCDIDDSIDDEMTWHGYEADFPEEDEELDEDYIERRDDWGEPYDSAEIVKTIRDLTNNYTSQDGTLRTYYRVEKNAAMNELRNYYNVVEVSDGRRDEHDDINWVIAYADPITQEGDTKNESLLERRLDPDNDMMGTRYYYAIKFDGDTIETVDVEDPDYGGDEFYVAVEKSKELLNDYDAEHVEIVYTVEDNFDKHEDVEYAYWPNEEVEENLNEDIPNMYGDGFYRIDIKHVKDSDGFLTDYTWWYDAATGKHLFIFGDSDVYTPGDSSPDWETDSEETAQEWWDNYVGLYEDADEDLDEGFFNSLSAIESKVLGRNQVDSLEEMSKEQLEKEIRAAKSLVNQAQQRGDEKSESMFKKWQNVLERTLNGEEHVILRDEDKQRVLDRVQGTIITNELSEDDARRFVNTLVDNGVCDKGTFNDVVTSDAFMNMWNELFPVKPVKECQEDEDHEDDLYEGYYVDLNKDIVFIADACNFDHDTMEPTDTIDNVQVTMPELIKLYGETVVEIAMSGVTRQAVQKAGGIPSNWDIAHLINNVASKKFHEAKPNKGFVMGRMIEVENINLLPDAVELVQHKLGDMLLPKDESLEEAVNDLSHPEQEFDSAATSINSNKLPAIYNMVNFNEGDVVIDFGGGKFDNAVEYIKDKGATLVVYDPYNRSAEHNEQVLATLEENGGADAAVNSNVLNVIKEPEARKAVLQNIKQLTKPGAPIYITVYEGRGDGVEGPTKSGYQLNRKTEGYLDEVREVFPNAVRKGKLIFATNN